MNTHSETIQGIRSEHDEREKEQIIRVLRATGGNVAKSSRVLGLSRYALMYRMRKYEIAGPVGGKR
jgi:transcriptional regulator with GAF, ATPase, and Fis domain